MLYLLAALVCTPVKPINLYVSLSGNDRWSGRLAKPNSRRTDGPLKSIEAARNKLRLAPGGAPARVQIEPGIYRLERPIVFLPEDSGSPGAERVYVGQSLLKDITPRARSIPFVSGMRPIGGWKRLPNGWIQTTISDVRARKWYFSQLFVNGQRRYRPRLPRVGYYQIAEHMSPTDSAKGHGFDRFGFAPGEIRADWTNRDDIEVLGFHQWSMSRNRIKEVDEVGRIVTFKAPTGYEASWDDFPKGNRFLVENVKEALSQPGEWYLDRSSGTLTYVPKAGETAANIRVEAPVAESVLEFRGDLARRRWVEHIQVANLGFEGTNWNLAPLGRNFPQAEIDLPGAVRFEGARDCSLVGCEVSNVGAYAVDIGKACKRIMITKSSLLDLGAGGVKVGEQANEKDPELLTDHCQVSMNVIEGGGRLHPAAVGVWIGQNSYISVKDNVIRDLYYTGISVGWSWGYQENGAHHNLIEGNRISLIGQGVLSDMGGIYTLGPQPGTVLRGNRIENVESFSYGGWGIYPDEGSTGILIEDNCIFRTKSAGFHQHYGKENIVRNNVFAFGGEAQIMRTRAEPHLSFTFERNLVIFADAPLLGSNWSGDNYRLDHNLYWRLGGKSFDFAGMSVDQWRAKGQDVHSVIADPLFKDPEKGDFQLSSDSPAFHLGFKEFWAQRPAPTEGPRRYPRAFP